MDRRELIRNILNKVDEFGDSISTSLVLYRELIQLTEQLEEFEEFLERQKERYDKD